MPLLLTYRNVSLDRGAAVAISPEESSPTNNTDRRGEESDLTHHVQHTRFVTVHFLLHRDRGEQNSATAARNDSARGFGVRNRQKGMVKGLEEAPPLFFSTRLLFFTPGLV